MLPSFSCGPKIHPQTFQFLRRFSLKTLRPVLLALSVSLLAILTACGGGGGGNNTPIVSISGASSTIAPGGTFSLTATVTNDSGSAGVNWTLAGAGTLTNNTTTGVTYTAPALPVPVNPSVTITATSIADTSSNSSVTFLIQQPAVQVLQYINGQYAFEATGFDDATGPRSRLPARLLPTATATSRPVRSTSTTIRASRRFRA